MSTAPTTPPEQYRQLLRAFCENGSEEVLYRASLLSQGFIAEGLTPDEIVALHSEAVLEVVQPFEPRSLVAAQQLLLEVMIAYGVRYAEYAEFRLAEARRAIDEEHGRADAATRADQERRDLLAAISHELGTPLTVAKGNVAAIRRFLAENNRLSQEVANRALDAELAIERLLRLREELIAATRNETRELELEPLSVRSAVTRAVNWARPSLDERNLNLVLDLGDEELIAVADSDAFQSIMSNLLSNAIRYTPPGGTVTVSARQSPAGVAISVSDTGIGMTPEAQTRLFERFYRAPEARQMASWGLGLGMAITNDLLQAIGGSIVCRSVPGSGTTFVITLAGIEKES